MTAGRPELYPVPAPGGVRLAVMAHPAGGDRLEADLRALRAAGVDVLLSLQPAAERRELDLSAEPAAAVRAGLVFRELPTVDFGVPDPVQAAPVLAALAGDLRAGRYVVVHCRGGVGRSGTVAAALLVLLGVPLAQAWRDLAVARGRPVPETDAQRRWPRRFDPATPDSAGNPPSSTRDDQPSTADGAAARAAWLAGVAERYLATIVGAVRREYPHDLHHPMTGPRDRSTPRELHPAFYGCYDWHSAVEMHWALVRLLRRVPQVAGAGTARAVLDAHLTAPALATEAAYLAGHPGFERPYGWGWALTLAHELSTWDDPGARRWSAHLAPLAGTVTDGYLAWLPRATYPNRVGTHGNTAFGLVRAVPYARAQAAAGRPDLLAAIRAAAHRWYAADVDCPAGWEPGGTDFLSPALAEVELMAAVPPPGGFAAWLDRFLPGLVRGEPASLFTPAVVADPADGQTAHLHGLNLYRGYMLGRLAETLSTVDPRVPALYAAAQRHAQASLPAVCGGPWPAEHWLASYAVLLLS